MAKKKNKIIIREIKDQGKIKEINPEENEAQIEDPEFGEEEHITPTGKREALVLKAENTNLETVAETAPAPKQAASPPTTNLYAAKYSQDYSTVTYENIEQQRIIPQERPTLPQSRGLNFSEFRQVRSAWDTPESVAQRQQDWDAKNLPEEKRYHPAEDKKKEEQKASELRRRRSMAA